MNDEKIPLSCKQIRCDKWCEFDLQWSSLVFELIESKVNYKCSTSIFALINDILLALILEKYLIDDGLHRSIVNKKHILRFCVFWNIIYVIHWNWNYWRTLIMTWKLFFTKKPYIRTLICDRNFISRFICHALSLYKHFSFYQQSPSQLVQFFFSVDSTSR